MAEQPVAEPELSSSPTHGSIYSHSQKLAWLLSQACADKFLTIGIPSRNESRPFNSVPYPERAYISRLFLCLPCLPRCLTTVMGNFVRQMGSTTYHYRLSRHSSNF
ncbi:hypothetical protein C8J56DRAFT_1161873 [Mycena floridula]|nr:hypothetical protein C8J56DRAFT_1161873 [Mycena floridula]